jgi:hypothetical protein
MERKAIEAEFEMILCVEYGWKQHPKFAGNIECKICLDTLKNKYVLETDCKHFFDHACIMETLINHSMFKCPICSKKYTKNNKIEKKLKLIYNI